MEVLGWGGLFSSMEWLEEMDKKREIVRYRERLDKTLSSTVLTNEDTLKSLVKDQLINSSQNEFQGSIDNIVEKRTSQLSNFLDMLRSTSVNDHDLAKSTQAHGEWKLKQDNDEFRVMYREGPQGTPLHTLLVEGYVDGPVDVCLCVSWESELYKKWWPQSHVPSFKVTVSKCLQRVRINEQISLVRMKLMWPMSTREAVVHYYLFEYLEDDLIVGLVNTIPDLNSIDKSTHGYTSDGIPEAKDVVRIGMVGGFALQKVTRQRSYFRTITSMDIKLDFIPPSLMNFISRQLVGNGFLLYQKSVTSVTSNSEDFNTALKDPLYAHLREGLYSNEPEGTSNGEKLSSNKRYLPMEGNSFPDDKQNMEMHSHEIKSMPEHAEVAVEKDFCEIKEEQIEESGSAKNNENLEVEIHHDDTSEEVYPKVIAKKTVCEIEEDGSEECVQIDSSEKSDKLVSEPSVNLALHNVEVRKKVTIRPEVEHALGILDKAISMLREYGFSGHNRHSNDEAGNRETMDTLSPENKEICSTGDDLSRRETSERISHDSSNARSNSYTREVNHNRIAPTSPEEYFSIPIDTNQTSRNWTKEVGVGNRNSEDSKKISIDSNNININEDDEKRTSEEKKLYQAKRVRFCCFVGSGI